MTIYLIKKEKGRIYESEAIVRTLFGLELSHNKDGAPLLGGELHISISDTKNYWACALEPFPVGIDMEEKDRVVKPAVVKRLHKDEQAYLGALSEGGREWTEEFLSIWTRKEAYAKYAGKGLALGFAKFSVLECSAPAVELDSKNALGGEGVGAVVFGANGGSVPVRSFEYKKLVFGIAGADSAEVVVKDYAAPMEKPALDYAAGLLDSRAYSQAALLEKLTDRGYTLEESEEAIEKLKGYGYVDDEAYAKALARRGSESGKGSRRIAAELQSKGVAKDLAREAAAEYKDSEYPKALELAQKLAEKAGWPGRASFSGGADRADAAGFSGGADRADAAGFYDGAADPDEPLSREQKEDLYEQRRKLAGKISRKLSALGYEASIVYAVLEDLGL